ncbi:MAG: hypothetical protein QOE96_3776 [Blastocatellia bacterium]|nr:hypothetical protein [Blastocatellia bacterium]
MALLNKVLNIPIRQEDVDFVMPDVDDDRRLGIDPFLLYRSSRADFHRAHDQLLTFFNFVLRQIREGNLSEAERLLLCPEPGEVGLGYSKHGTRGSGIGPELAREIAHTFHNSPSLLSRGLRHIEELQLICPGVGPDRISDVAANVLKLFLIGYTQEQCRSWSIPIGKDVPVNHYFDFTVLNWHDGYFDLPVNPSTGAPLLLVPRRILRVLPWINYDDYLGDYSKSFLRPVSRSRALRLKPRSFSRGAHQQSPDKAPQAPKPEVCKVTVQNTAALDTYVERKEREAANAVPTELSTLQDIATLKEHANSLSEELSGISPGKEDAYKYQDLVHRILTFCFHPHLADGRPQERTCEGTLIRDLVFSNEGARNFWRHVMQEYGGFFIVFELKNKTDIKGGDVDQVATYLGDAMGRLGFLVSRGDSAATSFNRRKAVFNKDSVRKVILHFTDKDLVELLKQRSSLKDTTDYVQEVYRKFMVSLE